MPTETRAAEAHEQERAALRADVQTWLDHHRHTARFLDEQQREDVADFLTQMIAMREAGITTSQSDSPVTVTSVRATPSPAATRALAAGAGRGEVG